MIVLYRCDHCGKLYEHPRFSCLWCANGIRRIELSKDDYDVLPLSTADATYARHELQKELDRLKERGIEN